MKPAIESTPEENIYSLNELVREIANADHGILLTKEQISEILESPTILEGIDRVLDFNVAEYINEMKGPRVRLKEATRAELNASNFFNPDLSK